MRQFFLRIAGNPFIQNSFILFVGTMIVNVLNYVFHVVVGRIVPPTSYGEIESLISLLTIILVPAGTLTLIATKYSASLRAQGNQENLRGLSLYLQHKVWVYGLPIFFLSVFLTPLFQKFLGIENPWSLVFIWCTMFLAFLSAVTLGLLTGWQRFGDVNKVNIASALLKLGGVLGLLFIGFGVGGVTAGLMLAALLAYLVAWFLLKKLFKNERGTQSEIKEISYASIRQYALPAFYSTLAVAILGNIDMIFAKHHLEGVISGEYASLSVAAKTIFFVTGVLTTVLFAMSSEQNEKKGNMFATFWYALSLVSFVAFASVIFFALFPSFVLGTLFGETYLDVSHLLVWFAIAAGLYSVGNLILLYLMSLHEIRVAKYFLALAGLEIAILFFFGENLYAIIAITIVTQILTIICGSFFLFLKMRRHA